MRLNRSRFNNVHLAVPTAGLQQPNAAGFEAGLFPRWIGDNQSLYSLFLFILRHTQLQTHQ